MTKLFFVFFEKLNDSHFLMNHYIFLCSYNPKRWS